MDRCNEDQYGKPRIDLKQELNTYRKQAITAAEDLLYGTVVINDIKMRDRLARLSVY